MDPSESVLRHNLDYVDTLYRKWLEDPGSVEASWAAFFEGYHLGLRHGEEDALASLPAGAAAGDETPIYLTDAGAVPEGVDRSSVSPALRVYDLVHGYRTYGHLLAAIDPLGLSERTHPLLELDQFGLTAADFDHRVRCENFKAFREGTIGDFLTALQETYCASIGVEYMDVLDREPRDWMQEQMEPARSRWQGSLEERRSLLRELVFCDAFEEGLHRMYVGQKRFSLEGGTTLVPLLRRLIEESAEVGGEQIVIGMAHRGRLNVLAHVLNKRYEYILAEFEGRPLAAAVQGYGDVKYHLGYSTDYETITGKTVHVSMAFNPSHLEAVNPVVEGIVRAKQNQIADHERRRVVPVLVHGDAAFAGQGVVAETFMLAGLEGYDTGGTVHVIVNNQVGFTTDPGDSRSTQYCSDLAKTARAPVFHVNADDAEAVIYVTDLALQYRQRFQRDVVIDLVCYRRYGHNEMDDPTFTQPVMYERVKAHPSNSRVYEAQLRAEGVVDDEVVDAFREESAARLEEARAAAKDMTAQYVEQLGGVWKGLRTAGHDWSARTRVPRETLDHLARSFVAAPDTFKWHGRLKKLMTRRSAMVLEEGDIDWGCAEMLAFGSLVLEGTKVRLTGQDSIRGTFSHRHAAYFDQATGEAWCPINHLSNDQARFQNYNSPLSEEACLGFEYGYSTADPWTLVCWEAQFGDFVNGAQVVIDQLIASCEYKWGRMSGLVLMLPHGYEGQGPEHSSARLERFLELCAEQNMQVCNCTTPAQFFHLLRRQAKRDFRKPLVVMTPKSLLRHPEAVSSVSDFTDDDFHLTIDDAEVADPEAVKRLYLVSGKFFYTLNEARKDQGADDAAIVRVEQLYPWPVTEYKALFARYRNLKEVVWVQEEPENMGPWRHLRHRMEEDLPKGVSLRHVSRDAAAVPATGSYDVHRESELALLHAAFRKKRPARRTDRSAERGRRRSS
jgi:2-oxoglutarate dehydrogenase E1 component